MVTTLLLLLLGGFIQANRGHFSLINATEDREMASRAARSVYEYCLYRLENDQTWAASPFSADQVDLETAGYIDVQENGGTRRIEGEIPGLKAEFEVDITNDLAGSKTAMFLIRTRVGPAAREIEAQVRVAPLYDGSAVTGGDMVIGAIQWVVGSKDPYRNVVRAQGDIRSPSYHDLDFVGLANSLGETGSDRGILWSRNDIGFNLGGGIYQSVTSGSVMQDAITATGGLFRPNSAPGRSIHDLQLSDLTAPANTSTIQPGSYRFTQTGITYESYEQTGTDMLGNPEYGWVTRTANIPVLLREDGGVQDYWYSASSLASLGTTQNVSFSLGGTAHVEANDEFFLDGGTSLMRARLDTATTTPMLEILGDGQIDVNGSFEVLSDGDLPEVKLGQGAQSGQLKATGDVTIQGWVRGVGVVISETGSARLQVGEANTDPNQMGLSLFAARDIELESPAGGGSDLFFNGLVYARDNFRFNSNAQRLRIEGALVARNGDLTITGATEVDFTYNPDYLELLVESLPDQRTRLELVVWKE